MTNVLIFFFIFFLLVIIILAIHFSGIAQTINSTTSDPTSPLHTLPQTTPVVTETTSQPETTSDTTATPMTEISTLPPTTYPPATIPVITRPSVTTTKKQSETTTTAQIPTTTTANSGIDISDKAMEERIEVRYLTIHDDSRPGIKLTKLKNIVIHYTGNPGTSADQNWRNFENNKPGTSAHFIIGLDGEIIQCMPLDEVAWAIGTTEGNYTSISIECCHPDKTGKFTDATYESLVKLVSWLCQSFGLGRDDVLRHYDYERKVSWGVWHKQCPLYWADDSDPDSHKRWEDFKNDLILD